MPSRAVWRGVYLCRAELCHAVPRRAVPCQAVPCSAVGTCPAPSLCVLQCSATETTPQCPMAVPHGRGPRCAPSKPSAPTQGWSHIPLPSLGHPLPPSFLPASVPAVSPQSPGAAGGITRMSPGASASWAPHAPASPTPAPHASPMLGGWRETPVLLPARGCQSGAGAERGLRHPRGTSPCQAFAWQCPERLEARRWVQRHRGGSEGSAIGVPLSPVSR